MARISRPRTARRMYLRQVLVFYDGPQVVLMQSDRGYPAIGIALDDDSNWFMHFTEVSEQSLARYLNEKAQLSWLFKEGSKRRYLADWAELDERGWVDVTRVDVTDEAWFPQPGFWARHHTQPFGATSFANDKVASFAIDGSWDASDFSKFYGKMADLYALLAVTSGRVASHLTDETRRVAKDAITKAAWRGGGSYVGFYDRIFSSVFALSPLKVRRISYASPGTIDLKGSEEPLRDISRVVETFNNDNFLLTESVNAINKILSDEQLKTASVDAQFSTPGTQEYVYNLCYLVNQTLGIDEPKILFDLCGENVLVFSKITLSFYRRAKDLAAFHVEGRVDSRGFVSDSDGTANRQIGITERI